MRIIDRNLFIRPNEDTRCHEESLFVVMYFGIYSVVMPTVWLAKKIDVDNELFLSFQYHLEHNTQCDK